MFPPEYDAANPTREQVEIAWAAHGLSVVVVEEEPQRQAGAVTRRHPQPPHHRPTPFRVNGPAAGTTCCGPAPTRPAPRSSARSTTAPAAPPRGAPSSPARRTSTSTSPTAPAPPTRPATASAPPRPSASGSGSTSVSTSRRSPTRSHRFGWVVELDPYDPDSTPRQAHRAGPLQARGRQRRIAPDGRAVVYIGDDERFDYFYKFVSRRTYEERHGRRPAAQPHAARRRRPVRRQAHRRLPGAEIDGTGKLPNDGEFDGTGEWIPLATGQSHVPGMTADEVYVFTRLAGDKVGATKMDRPEDIEAPPHRPRSTWR